MNSQDRIEIDSGNLRAVFLREAEGWRPDWFYEGEVSLLRFKDHEWLSIGRVVYPRHAATMERLPDGGLAFAGREGDVSGTAVNWRVVVRPGGDTGWFRIETELKPDADLILTEAMSFFESPYAYDGSEDSMTLLGANPATIWRGKDRITPPVHNDPRWCYARGETARATYGTHNPLLLHRVTAEGQPDRNVAMVADFRHCSLDEIQVTPTRTVPTGAGGYGDFKRAAHRGYKYILGAGNWTSSFEKDPPYHVPAKGMTQVVELQASTSIPGGARDRWIIAAWSRAARINGYDGRPPAVADVYRRLQVDWKTAGEWLHRSFLIPGSTGLATRERGPVDYLKGTRPLADYCYGPGWRFYLGDLLVQLDYRIRVLGRDEEGPFIALQELLMEHNLHIDAANPKSHLFPKARAAAERFRAAGMEGPFVDAIRDLPDPERPDLAASVARALTDNDSTPGIWAGHCRRLLPQLTNETYPVFLPLLDAMERSIDPMFWAIAPYPRRRAHLSGGQANAHTMLQMAHCFATAWQTSGEERWLRGYCRLVNHAVGWCFHTFRGRGMPEDLDLRGMAHACTAGRDQQADIPPMENSSLAAAMAWLDTLPLDCVEPAWLDCVFLMRHTALCQYPVARTHVRGYRPGGGFHWLPGEHVASHRHLQESVPYFSYENPVDQTLIATYQSYQGLHADLFMGGALADAGDDVLTIVPRAARLDRDEFRNRCVLVFNPLQVPVETTLRVFFPGQTLETPIHIGPREIFRETFACPPQ